MGKYSCRDLPARDLLSMSREPTLLLPLDLKLKKLLNTRLTALSSVLLSSTSAAPLRHPVMRPSAPLVPSLMLRVASVSVKRRFTPPQRRLSKSAPSAPLLPTWLSIPIVSFAASVEEPSSDLLLMVNVFPSQRTTSPPSPLLFHLPLKLPPTRVVKRRSDRV